MGVRRRPSAFFHDVLATVSELAPSAPPLEMRNPQKRALLIGVKYEANDNWDNLRWSHEDVRKVRRLLTSTFVHLVCRL